MEKEKAKNASNEFSVAPMMDWTTRHCRYFHRLLTTKALLYTEMVTSHAVLRGNKEVLLCHSQEEQPIVLQLGGNNAKDLAQCAIYAQKWGYQGVNLNVGCPSDKVSGGNMGACLMAKPIVVAQLIQDMLAVVDIPVTIKHRIGITGRTSYSELVNFIGVVADAGCKTFIIHARIAMLTGLSAKQNRIVPPLKPHWVYQIKKDFPHLNIIFNGGVNSWEEVIEHKKHTDGVMVGRTAYHNPWFLTNVDQNMYGMPMYKYSRMDIVEAMVPYIESTLCQGVGLWQIVRHMLGLYYSIPGGRAYRRYLSEHANQPNAGPEVLMQAVKKVVCAGNV